MPPSTLYFADCKFYYNKTFAFLINIDYKQALAASKAAS